MNYERGLARLQELLKNMDDEETVRQVMKLEVLLRTHLRRYEVTIDDPNPSQELECIIADLNKVAYRTVGTSFISLCTNPQRKFSDAISTMSLGTILSLILMSLCLLAIGIALASSVIETIAQSQIEQIRQEIQTTDTRIGNQITSFFYLSHIDPCSDNTLQKVMTAGELDIQKETMTTKSLCVWEYKDIESGKIIARDHWSTMQQLLEREYFRNGTPVARDHFDWQGNDCPKHREYLDDRGEVFSKECYTEAGELRTLEPDDTWVSPIPPVLYWFFYR